MEIVYSRWYKQESDPIVGYHAMKHLRSILSGQWPQFIIYLCVDHKLIVPASSSREVYST